MLFGQRLTALWHKFKALQGSPSSLARGAAIGVFIGFAPVMPLKSMLILLLTGISRSSTVAALLVGTVICNPLTYLPLYYLAWFIGDLVLPGRANWATMQATVDQMRQAGMMHALSVAGQIGFDTGLVLLAGGCLVALPLALLSYPLVLRFFLKIEQTRRDKHLLNQNPEEKAA